MEILAVHYENQTKHRNKMCRQNAETFNVKAGGTYGNHFKGLRVIVDHITG
jgi:2-phosphoglycerate kinase